MDGNAQKQVITPLDEPIVFETQQNTLIVVDIAQCMQDVVKEVCKCFEIDETHVNMDELKRYVMMDIEWWVKDGMLGDTFAFLDGLDGSGLELVKGG